MHHRNHFAALDGLRGLAAISVLIFHLGHWLGIAGLAANARLAVDLFFCLSGYVVPMAYQRHLETGMTLPRFMGLRAARLWPMILAGTLISAAYLLIRRLALHDMAIAPQQVGLATLLSMLCLPDFNAPVAIGGPQIFPLNGPQYTLFFELLVNFAWAATPRLRGVRSAVLMVTLCFALIAMFGSGGDQQATFWRGFARVFGSFYTGVLVYHLAALPEARISRLAHRDIGPVATAACLVLTATLFYWPEPLPGAVNWLWSLLVAPALVFGGRTVVLSGWARRFALWLGALSYPLYVLHYPLFVWINGIFQKLAGHKAPLLEAVIIAPLAIAASMIVLRCFDEPLRAILTRSAKRSGTAADYARSDLPSRQP